AVDENALAPFKARHERLRAQLQAVRGPLARRALLVLERRGDFPLDVLYQRAPARDVQNLHAVADRQKRYAPLLAGLQKQKVSPVAQGVHAAQAPPGLSPVELRVYVRVAPRQKDAFEPPRERFNKLAPGYERHVQ